MDGNINIVSFPGLGIGEITLNEIAFTVPIINRPIAWYGIIITVGMVLAFIYAIWRAKFEKISTDDMLDYAIYIIIFGVIGARAYYVIMNPGNYNSFYDVIATWNGGLAIYGGIIGGFLAALVVSIIKKLKFFKLLDVAGPACMIGQILGRWGNFINAEAHGGETTLPWRMGLHKVGYTVYDTPVYVHPTFLYESLWNLLGLIFINLIYKKKKFDGQIFLLYITWYGFGRMFIEGLRTDSLMIGEIRVSQALAFLTVVAGLILIVVGSARAKKSAKLGESLVLVDEAVAPTEDEEKEAEIANESVMPEKASEPEKDNDKANKKEEDKDGKNN